MAQIQTIKNGEILTAPGNFQECLAGLSFNYERALEQQDYFRRELERIRNDKWRDEELQRLRQEIETLQENQQHQFYITTNEQTLINAWIIKHCQEQHRGNCKGGVSGGMFSYIFTPTAIGTIGTIKCTVCGEEYTFSDI